MFSSVHVCRRTKIRCEPIRTNPVHWVPMARHLILCNGWRPSLVLFISPPSTGPPPAFALREHCMYYPSPGGCYRSTTHRLWFQRDEIDDRSLRHRMHYIGDLRPHFFAIRQGSACPMRGGMGLGAILPISCVPWPTSLALPRFQSYNSNGQNPCEIAGFLDTACTGSRALSIPTPEQITCSSIPPNSHWIRPITRW